MIAPLIKSERAFKPIPKILNFIEQKMRGNSCPYFTAKQILKEYKAAYPDEYIHINRIAFTLAILRKEGKIQKWNNKTWKWIADGGEHGRD